ncbi:hypothetical protein BDC45DRAFT_540665 [Circinella umbellata]|nr:hypothetical protein BDC45DRAFT_540665 [Circinella umbellata]
MVHPKLSDDDIIAAVLEDELDLPLVATESDESIAIPEIEPEPIISSREKLERIEKVISILDDVEHLTVKDELRKIRDELLGFRLRGVQKAGVCKKRECKKRGSTVKKGKKQCENGERGTVTNKRVILILKGMYKKEEEEKKEDGGGKGFTKMLVNVLVLIASWMLMSVNHG